MYSTKNAITMSLSDIVQKLSDYDIYAYYMGKFQVGKLYNSPLRSTDKVPSFAVFPSRTRDLLFKDHGSGDTGNAITFCRMMSGAKTKEDLEKELLKILRSTDTTTSAKRTIQYHTNKYEIGIVRQPFGEVDSKYWAQYGISEETLRFYNVFSIKYYLLNKTVRAVYKDDCPMYAYKINDHFKIYRPYAPKQTKWRTNLTEDDVQGYEQLLKDLFDNVNVCHRDLLIITKSLKDVMVLREMGYYAVSPSSETTFLTEQKWNWLRKSFKHIVMLYDRDKTGVQKSREFSRKYGVYAFFVNKRYNAKDISDAVKTNGFDTIKQWLDNTLKCYIYD